MKKRLLVALSIISIAAVTLILGCQQTGEIPEIFKIVDRSPALEATGVSVTTPLSITFNFSVDAAGITKENLFSNYLQFGSEHTAGNPTITTLTWSADQKTVTLAVSGWSGDPASVVHIVPRSDKLKDVFNNPLRVDLWKFTLVGSGPTTSTTSTTTSTSSTTTMAPPNFSWTQKTGSAAFSARSAHTSVVFNNKIWVIGGNTVSGKTNEVWSSIDGNTWILATLEAAFPPIHEHSSVVFNNKMWVIAGANPSFTNEVWSSDDGIIWNLVTPEAAFAKRSEHASVVFDGKIWVIGGGQPYMSDVWYSTDGETWTQATASAAFGDLANHSASVLDGNIWVVGGRDSTIFDDAWYSSDGMSWNKAGHITASGILTSESETSRMAHTAVTYNFNGDDKMFVIGGYNSWGGTNYLNDLWYTDNGASWIEAPVSTTYPVRSQHSSVVFDSKIWVIGGFNGLNSFNDVWYSPLP
jgi:leucine-zipper-like transcriptional regulator 1